MPVMLPRRSPIAAGSGALALAVLAASLSACGGSSTGLGRLTTSGVVQYATGHGPLHPAGSGQMLNAGDRVQVMSGNASIRLTPDGLLELRPGTAMTINKVPRLTAGGVLIEPGGHAVQVAAANATLAVPFGAAQLVLNVGLDAGLAAKVYQERSSLQIPGNPVLGLVAPRQADLTIHSLLPIPAIPLKYDDADAWDRRYLGTAEAFSRQLTAAATGFDAQLPSSQLHDAAFYQQLLPGLVQQRDFGPAFQAVQGAPDRSSVKPGGYLIALAMAMRSPRGSFEDRLRQALGFKSQGADWGLVAIDVGVTDLNAVLNDVLTAIGRASQPFTSPGSGQVAFGPPQTAPTAPGRTGGRLSPTTIPPSRNRPTTTGATAAPTTPTTVGGLVTLPRLPRTGTPLDPLLDPLVDPLIDLLNHILGGRP